MMRSLSKTLKDIIKNIAILGVIEIVLGAVLVAVFFGYSFILGHVLGIIYGTLLAVWRMRHLEKSINASIEFGEQMAASRYFRFKYFLRTFATAIVLGIAFWIHPIINIMSVAVGLLNAPIATHIYKFFSKDRADNNE